MAGLAGLGRTGFLMAGLALCLVAWSATPARADAQAETAARTRCTALKSDAFEALIDAPTTILSATIVTGAEAAGEGYKPNSYNGTPLADQHMAAATDLPDYCRVTGMVQPQVAFELRLPLAGWNSRFLMQGCGGMCGIVSMESCEDALVRDYAVANTDMGHQGDGSTTGWATDTLQPKIDFGYRATHVVTLAAKAIIAAYYRHPPAHAYFRGCSTGGRQALIEAERFPDDFDGIIAGAPPLDESGDGFLHLVWSARASVDENGKSLFDVGKIGLLHKAALDACNAVDGVIENPAACHFDPAKMQCAAGSATNCLTATEVGVARKIYAGAHDSAGRKLFPGGMQPGSEDEWVPLFIGTTATIGAWHGDGHPLWLNEKVALMLRRVMMYSDPGNSFDLLKLDFSKYPEQLRLIEPIYDARNPDLRAFAAHGGKLILYHGWNDAEVPTNQSIDYYSMVTRVMGGPEATAQFFRMFLIPGMAHCRRGPGADTTDYLTAMQDWVEQHRPPDRLISYHLKNPQNYMGLPAIRYPLPPDSYSWSRPVYAYPSVAVYAGHGDRNDAASWKQQ